MNVTSVSKAGKAIASMALALLCHVHAAAANDAPGAMARFEKLVASVRSGDYAEVRSVLAGRGVDPNRPLADGSTLLAWAVENQDRRMVELLLKAASCRGRVGA